MSKRPGRLVRFAWTIRLVALAVGLLCYLPLIAPVRELLDLPMMTIVLAGEYEEYGAEVQRVVQSSLPGLLVATGVGALANLVSIGLSIAAYVPGKKFGGVALANARNNLNWLLTYLVAGFVVNLVAEVSGMAASSMVAETPELQASIQNALMINPDMSMIDMALLLVSAVPMMGLIAAFPLLFGLLDVVFLVLGSVACVRGREFRALSFSFCKAGLSTYVGTHRGR